MSGAQAGTSAYRIDRARYELTELHLEPDEMRALQVAVAAVRPTQGREALWKLGLDSIEGEAAGDVAVTATVPELPGLPALRDASARRRAVGVRLPRQGPPARSVRAAAAHRVLVRRRARSRTRRAAHVPRRPHRGRGRPSSTTRRSSVRSATTCARRSRVDPKELGAGGCRRRGRRARRRRPRRQRRARARARARRLADTPTAPSTSRCPCANVPAFRSWVLGLLDHAVVLSPPDVRRSVVDWLRSMVGA